MESLWIDQPNVLFDREHLKKFIFTPGMGYNEKMNAMARFVIYLGIIAYLYLGQTQVLYIPVLALGGLYYMHNNKRQTLEDWLKNSGNSNGSGNGSSQQGGGEALGTVDPECGQLVDSRVVIDPLTNQRCKLSSPDNPFGNNMPGDSEVANATPACHPEVHKQEIDNNFHQNLFSDINDVWQRNNQARQFNSNPSTTIVNDRASFMKWLWDTPFVCKDGDMDACFKQGY